MNNLFIMIASLFMLNQGFAQTKNSNGLYVNNEGELYTGIISEVQNDLRSDFQVKDGLLAGEARFYYANGKLMETGNYDKGQKNDKWIRYNESGTILAVAFYNLGKKTGAWIVYDENGNKRCELKYTDGQKTGIWTSWDAQGMVTSTKDYTKIN